MTINSDVQSTSGQTPEEGKESIEGTAREIAQKVEVAASEVEEKARGAARKVAASAREMRQSTSARKVVLSSLLISGACIGSVIIASLVRRRRPLETFAIMSEELPFVGERKRRMAPFVGARERRRRRNGAVLAGIGSIVGGSVVLAAMNQAMGRTLGHRPIVRGAIAVVGAVVMDALVAGPSYVRTMVKMLGPGGTALTYGAIGGACALSSRRKKEHGEWYEAIEGEDEAVIVPPMYSGAEVGTVSGALEHPQPLV